MISMPGYYSIVQYCPDRTRMETANLGVILFCPGYDFLKIRFLTQFGRHKNFFRRDDLDEVSLLASLGSIRNRLDSYHKDFRGKEDFEQFAESCVNEILVTVPRSIKVGIPEDDLKALFSEAVSQRKSPTAKKPSIPELDRVFRNPRLEGIVEFDRQVKVPIIGQSLKIDYIYKNGVMNLVRPELFSPQPQSAISQAKNLAIGGKLIQERRDEINGMERKLIIVSKFAERNDTIRDTINELMQDFKIRYEPIENLESLESEILASAHA